MRLKITNIVFLILVSISLFAQNSEHQSAYFSALNRIENENIESAINQLKDYSDCIECKELLAELYYENGNSLKAVALYKELALIKPSNSYFMLAVIYASMGFAEEGVAYLESYFEYKNPKFYSEIISQTEFDIINSSAIWSKFWESNRYSTNDLKLEEAAYLISQEDYNEAVVILENLNYPKRSDLSNYLLAKVYFEQGSMPLASKYIDLSLEKNSDFIKALELSYEVAEIVGDYSKCNKITQLLLKENQYNPDYILMQAKSSNNLGNFGEADKYVKMYLQAFPDNEEAKFTHVKILINWQDYRNALISLNELLEKNTSKYEYFTTRGDIYYLMESWYFASNDYSMSLDIKPKQADAYYHYGMCAYHMNDQKKACNAWRKAAKMKNKEAAKMLFQECGL